MSISDYSSNAILSKAHAMYGRHLTEKNYDTMLECTTVSQIMLYLKNNTEYAQVLSPLNENNVHRGQLEVLLRQHLFYQFADLFRYENVANEKFSNYIIERTEIELISQFLILLLSGRGSDYIYSLPLYFDKITSIDLHAFADIKSFNEFVEFLSKSKYYDILKPFTVKENEKPDIAKLEHALYSHLYGSTFEMIKKYIHGSAKKEMYDIFCTHIDMLNLMCIHRLKKFYKMEAEEIKNYLYSGGRFTKNQIDRLCSCTRADELFKMAIHTKSGRIIAKMDYDHAFEILQKSDYKIAKKYMTFSVNPVVVMISYINLAEIEISNIINIIEGIRYNMPSDKIRRLLFIN